MKKTIVDSLNPRSITALSADPISFVWISDSEELDESSEVHPKEVLNHWTADFEKPQTLIDDAKALGAPGCGGHEATSLLAIPVSRDGESYSLEVLCFARDKLGKVMRFDASSSVYLGDVSICRTENGFMICWERWTVSSVEIQMVEISRSMEILGPIRRLSLGALARSPRLTWDGAQPWLAWLSSRGKGAPWQVRLMELGRSRQRHRLIEECAFGVGGLELAASSPRRIWIAWHTDRRPARAADLTRWIEVRAVVGHVVKVPSGVPLWCRWGELGEDQGLEYPVFVRQSEGRLSLVARSSHRHWRFDLTKTGWSRPDAIDEPGWECRVRRPAVVAESADDGLMIARRQRQKVIIERIRSAPRRGGPPLLAAPRSMSSQTTRGLRRRSAARLGSYGLRFGDIHQHSAHSDGTGTIREAYERARDEYHDDFVSVTDHESFLGKRVGPGEWRRMMAECDLHDEPGRFVTLPGYEWTGSRHPGPGHRCVYWPSSDRPLLGREHPEARTSADLIDAVRRRGGLVFPHHVGWTGADAAVHDPEVQTCWEIVSSHGSYEALGVSPIGQRDTPLEGHFLRDQLDVGMMFGFVGGSDGHGLLWHHGIAHRRDSHRTGLTAVLVYDLTREALFEALRQRRCYATSGVPLIIDLLVNGFPMGSAIRETSKIEIEVMAEGRAALLRAELVRSDEEPIQLPINGSRVRSSLVLPAPRDGRVVFLYLRVEQIDGEVAWSSPVWVSR